MAAVMVLTAKKVTIVHIVLVHMGYGHVLAYSHYMVAVVVALSGKQRAVCVVCICTAYGVCR